jgi:UDP-N-acetylmuramate dehydrogenase
MNSELTAQLHTILPAERILVSEPMKKHCSFRTGGPADLFLQIRTAEELRKTYSLLCQEKINCFLLGRGTDILVGDGGYRGAVITMTGAGMKPATDTTGEAEEPSEEQREDGELQRLDMLTVHGTEITAGAGCSLARVAAAARDHALTGFEFAAGIPGSVGGGLMMNAGAYGGEIRQAAVSADLLFPDGTVRTIDGADMEFGYRTSLLKRVPAAALSGVFRLTPGNRDEIAAKMNELAERRREKQPLEYASAGSTFKRPEGYFAGKLIADAGLRGFRIGDAQISEKHCGFVINRGNATAAEIRSLIETVQEKVAADSGVRLEREVIYLGEF